MNEVYSFRFWTRVRLPSSPQYKKMKKVLLAAVLLLGVEGMAIGQMFKEQAPMFRLYSKFAPQEVFVFGTNSSQDGYITGGYTIGKLGLYAGFPYSERKHLLNQSNGTVSNQMRFGLMKQLQPNKVIGGVGVQPTLEGTKLHSFIGYNPLHSRDMKLWLIGNLTGSTFSFGAGLSYKIK